MSQSLRGMYMNEKNEKTDIMVGCIMADDMISIIVCTYDDPIELFKICIDSLLPQEKIDEIIVVDSSKSDRIKKFCNIDNVNEKIRYVYMPPKGLSEARNMGISLSKMNIVAFTDSDCIVDKNWAENIYMSFVGDIAVVGGKVLPKWISRPNKIFLNSAIAQGFFSLFDMGEDTKDVNQIFGGNFAINKSLITNQMFLSELGRRKENLLCGEEIDFCRKVIANKLKIIYNPSVIVWHQIPEERTKLKWMWKRLYYSGITRVMLGGMPTPKVVNYVKYNIYDILFLMIFVIPYLYGLFKAKSDICFRKSNYSNERHGQ